MYGKKLISALMTDFRMGLGNCNGRDPPQKPNSSCHLSWHGLLADGVNILSFYLISWVCGLQSRSERSVWFNTAQGKSVFLRKKPVTATGVCPTPESKGVCACLCAHVGMGRVRGGGEVVEELGRGSALSFIDIWWLCFSSSLAPRQIPRRLCLETPLRHPSHRCPDTEAKPDLPGGPGSAENLGCQLHPGLNRK